MFLLRFFHQMRIEVLTNNDRWPVLLILIRSRKQQSFPYFLWFLSTLVKCRRLCMSMQRAHKLWHWLDMLRLSVEKQLLMGRHCSVQLMLSMQTLLAEAWPTMLKHLRSSHAHACNTTTLLCWRSELVLVIVYIILYASLPHCPTIP